MNDDRKAILGSMGILAVVSFVPALSIDLLCGAAFNLEPFILIDKVRAQSKIIESMARFDRENQHAARAFAPFQKLPPARRPVLKSPLCGKEGA